MNTFSLNVGRVLSVAILFVSLSTSLNAQESKKGHSHGKAEMHGGTVAMSKMHHFEVVFKPDAIQVYLYDGRQNPLSAKGVEGTVTLKFRGMDAKTVPLQVAYMHHADADEEGMHKEMKHEEMEHEHGEKSEHKEHAMKKDGDHMSMSMTFLQADVDLGKVAAGTMKAVFSLKGLPAEKEREATFTETFKGFGGKKEMHHEKSETKTHKH